MAISGGGEYIQMDLKKIIIIILAVCFTFLHGTIKNSEKVLSVRKFADTTGFAQYSWQVDKLMKRISREQGVELENAFRKNNINGDTQWKVVISPHDDHAYVGYLYPAVLKNLKAKTIILFGVAHKAKDLGLENKLIFDKYEYWHGPYGPVKVSGIRKKLLKNLPEGMRTVNNEMHTIEHSLEALIPFIQYYNRDVEIIPILVPSMNYERISQIGEKLAGVIEEIASENQWKWGKDYALAISSDSVHYGDRDWGGKNYAKFGSDRDGYERAVEFEREIISNSLNGKITKERIKIFTDYTVKKEDHRKYKWTWCGRYSIPAGLMTAYYLSKKISVFPEGVPVGYRTSITIPPLKTKDLKMGLTAPANLHHWVGYTAIGYK